MADERFEMRFAIPRELLASLEAEPAIVVRYRPDGLLLFDRRNIRELLPALEKMMNNDALMKNLEVVVSVRGEMVR